MGDGKRRKPFVLCFFLKYVKKKEEINIFVSSPKVNIYKNTVVTKFKQLKMNIKMYKKIQVQ